MPNTRIPKNNYREYVYPSDGYMYPRDEHSFEYEQTIKYENVPQPIKRSIKTLTFSLGAWTKMLYFRDCGNTEVAGFGVSKKDNPLYIEDFITIKQKATTASVEFDDEAIADYMEDMVLKNYQPNQFMRVWCHTHPGNSASPSGTDIETFNRVFGECNWAIMFILAKDNSTTCKLWFKELNFETNINIEIDYKNLCDINASELKKEFEDNVHNFIQQNFTQHNFTQHNVTQQKNDTYELPYYIIYKNVEYHKKWMQNKPGNWVYTADKKGVADIPIKEMYEIYKSTTKKNVVGQSNFRVELINLPLNKKDNE
jgi:proteasome lid subunit RPN8/RPN11